MRCEVGVGEGLDCCWCSQSTWLGSEGGFTSPDGEARLGTLQKDSVGTGPGLAVHRHRRQRGFCSLDLRCSLLTTPTYRCAGFPIGDTAETYFCFHLKCYLALLRLFCVSAEQLGFSLETHLKTKLNYIARVLPGRGAACPGGDGSLLLVTRRGDSLQGWCVN